MQLSFYIDVYLEKKIRNYMEDVKTISIEKDYNEVEKDIKAICSIPPANVDTIYIDMLKQEVNLRVKRKIVLVYYNTNFINLRKMKERCKV